MREKNGQPVRIQDTQETFVPVDAITLLSGVNFGSVEKVLAAIAVLQRSTSVDIRDLASFYRCPTEKVAMNNPQHAERAMSTRQLVDRVVSEWVEYAPPTPYEAQYHQDVDDVLHITGRFGGPQVP